MIVRVLAILVALGLFVSSVDTASARTPSAPPASVLADDGDDAADIELVLPPSVPLAEPIPHEAFVAVDAPPSYQPVLFVFRPPRAYAFN